MAYVILRDNPSMWSGLGGVLSTSSESGGKQICFYSSCASYRGGILLVTLVGVVGQSSSFVMLCG